MKNIRKKLLAVVATLVAAFTLVAFGQAVRPLPVPAFWVGSTGDYFGVNEAAVPILRVGGTNFTGVSALVPASSNLVVRGGVIVGIVDP